MASKAQRTSNIRLYGRLGYRIFDTKRLNEKVSIVLMEKTARATISSGL